MLYNFCSIVLRFFWSNIGCRRDLALKSFTYIGSILSKHSHARNLRFSFLRGTQLRQSLVKCNEPNLGQISMSRFVLVKSHLPSDLEITPV